MVEFGCKVVSSVGDSGESISLIKGMVGVIVEVNLFGTYDVYFPEVEGKLRTLNRNEFEFQRG